MKDKMLSYLEARDVAALESCGVEALAGALLSLYESNSRVDTFDNLLDSKIAEAYQDMQLSRGEEDVYDTKRAYNALEDDYHRLEDQNNALKEKIEDLEQQLTLQIKHQGGRRDQYSPEQRQRILEFYHQQGETYRSTAEHFGISTNTVGRILKENKIL